MKPPKWIIKVQKLTRFKQFKIGSYFIFYCLSLLGLCACKPSTNQYQGYVEGNLTYVSTPFDGQLIKLKVQRGDSVTVGQLLYQLEPQPQSSAFTQALATVKQLTANLADLEKGGRPSELETINAQIDQAIAQLNYAKLALKRSNTLVKTQAQAQETLDQNLQNAAVLENKITELKANLTTAQLGGRIDAVNAAQAALEASQAARSQAEWSLQQKTRLAPVTGHVFDIYFRQGEQVPANRGVLSLLAPKDIKALFFVPETQLANISLGQTVSVGCDGCQKDIKATIRFISPIAEYTPPVIYSESTRSKLIFEVEAYFDDATVFQMHPGQPLYITVTTNKVNKGH